MLARTLKMTFWVVYDHLGKLLIANFVCVAMVMAPLAVAHAALISGIPGNALFIGLPVAVVALCIVAPVALAGLAWMIKEIIEKHDGSLKTLFAGMKRFGPRAALLGMVYGSVVVCLACSVWFYAARLGAWVPLLGYALSAAALWTLVFLLLTAVLCMPALVNKDGGAAATMKMAAVLTLANPLFLVGVTLHMLILAGLALMPPILLFFSVAPMAALQCSAYEMLSRKYAALRAYALSAPGAGKALRIDFGDENDEYLCRGFRDLLFPWKE